MAKKQKLTPCPPCDSPFNRGKMKPDHGETKSYERKEEKAMSKGMGKMMKKGMK